MSNVTRELEYECTGVEGHGLIDRIVQARDKDLGGFSVRRLLPTTQQRMVGPWIFFDHMGPADFPAGRGIDVRPHPHINLATVTYLFEGEILHRDSLGSLQPICPGDVNLMVAGRGIVHSERERPEHTAVPHRLHGLQLWLALPEADEECEPAFHHYPSATIPALEVGGVALRVIIGRAYGVSSPVRFFASTLYVEAHLMAGQTLLLPEAAERALYVAEGSLSVGGAAIPEHALAVLAPAAQVRVEASAGCRLALIGGEPLGHRFVDWNFVSSSKARIEQARRDWRDGRFPKVPGDEHEFIPLPD